VTCSTDTVVYLEFSGILHIAYGYLGCKKI